MAVLSGLVVCTACAHEVRPCPSPVARAAQPVPLVLQPTAATPQAPACATRLAVSELRELGPAPASNREQVSPDGEWRLKIERVPSRARPRWDRLPPPERWRVALTAADGRVERWLLGREVDEDASVPQVTWGQHGAALLMWKDRTDRALATLPVPSGMGQVEVDDLRFAMLAPGRKPIERSLGRPGRGVPAVIAEDGRWWMFRAQKGAITFSTIDRSGNMFEEPELVAVVDGDTRGSPLVRAFGERVFLLTSSSRHRLRDRSSGTNPWWSHDGLHVVVLERSSGPYFLGEGDIHPSEGRRAVATPLDVVEVAGGDALWFASSLEYTDQHDHAADPPELRVARLKHGDVTSMRTRFDFGFSSLRLIDATPTTLRGEVEREGKRYAFTISEVHTCQPVPRLECRARLAAREVSEPEVERNYKGSFRSWQLHSPDDAHGNASWITTAAQGEPRILPGEARAYAEFPATEQVLLSIWDDDARRTTLLLLDARTGAERSRLDLDQGWIVATAESEGAPLLGVIDSTSFRVVTVDDSGHVETRASVEGKWESGLFARTAAGWVLALEPEDETRVRRAAPNNGDIVILDEQARVLRRIDGIVDHRHPDVYKHAWSSAEGAAFVFGRSRFDLVTVDNQNQVAALQPVRLQFQREAESLIVDPLHAALPWEVATGALRGCD